MIESLTIHNLKTILPEKHADSVKCLEGRTFTFTPGINVLIGPNGTGKSSLLTIVKRLLHCEKGYSTKVNYNSVSETSINVPDKLHQLLPEMITFVHDGQVTYNLTGEQRVGLYDLGGFDDDFLAEGVKNTVNKRSSGERRLDAFKTIVDLVQKPTNDVPEIPHRYSDSLDTYHLRTATIPKGKRTILMDEPSEHFDLKNQILFWKVLKKLSQKYQIIIASHSMIPFFNNDVEFISMEKGYQSEVQSLLLEMEMSFKANNTSK